MSDAPSSGAELTLNKTDAILMGDVFDHIVDAIGDPSSTLRRAAILIDIDQYPGTTQNGVCERLNLEKSVVSRNVDWLFDHGCVVKNASSQDARETALQTSPYSHKHLQLALRSFGNHHEVLKKNLATFIGLFNKHMPSLREVKALLTVGAKGSASKVEITDNLYNGPPTTDQRAVRTLIEEGILEDNVS